MKNRVKDRKSHSLRKFCLTMILILSVLAAVSGAGVIGEAFSSAKRYTENNSFYTLRLCVNTLDGILHTLQNAGRNFLMDNPNIAILASARQPEERFAARRAISNDMSEILNLIPETDGLLFWTGDETVARVNTTAFDAVEQIREYVMGEIAKEGKDAQIMPNTRWGWHDIQGKKYLLSVVSVQDAYCVIWLEDEILTEVSGQEAIQENSGFDLYCVQDEALIVAGIRQKSNYGSLVLRQQSNEGDFTMCLATDSYDAYTERTVYLIMAVCVCIILGVYFVLRRLYAGISQAIGSLTSGVEQIGNDLTAGLDAEHNLQEVNQVFSALNAMADRIRILQTEIYERKIREQRMHIQFLEMQIKSHFYVNCLNIIYSLAATQRYQLIQEFTLYLVDFYRYIESAFEYMICLSEEITHISNYIEIQRIRYPGLITYQIKADHKTDGVKIPPLILLTFVENIFKHAMNMSDPIHITIRAELEEDNPKIKIVLEDDGIGFSENLRNNLNMFSRETADVDQYPGKRTGIINTICRLHMYYGKDVQISFDSGEAGRGSRITLFLPMKEGGTSV